MRDKDIFTPSQSIQKSYLRQPVPIENLETFRSNLKTLLDRLNSEDIEESNKGRVKTFLEHTLWTSNNYEINASGKTDLSIKDKNLNKDVVLFEFKKIGSNEMVTKYYTIFLKNMRTTIQTSNILSFQTDTNISYLRKEFFGIFSEKTRNLSKAYYRQSILMARKETIFIIKLSNQRWKAVKTKSPSPT